MDEGLADEERREEYSRQSKQQWSTVTFQLKKKKSSEWILQSWGRGMVYSIARVMGGLKRVQLMRDLTSHVKDLDFSVK